ncbi:hypothetical protein [Pseudomonas profundi]|uniref:hypothetical protein n=1 Tax=Pseudomonas profundi TaxID=1981513 RepID=UPI001CC25609|nr:hypothetical protein [Pseudomonas profundi]
MQRLNQTTAIIALATAFASAHADDFNQAHIHQDGEQQHASVWQTGMGNRSSTAQTESVLTEAFTRQDGSYNEADINQRGVSLSTAVDQIGELNQVDVWQYESAQDISLAVSQTGSGHLALVSQMHVEQTALIDQAGSGHRVDLSQFGEGNVATILQSGEGHSALVRQTGTQEFSTVYSYYGQARIEQSGIQQGASLNLGGWWNQVQLVQGGQDNRATVHQHGSDLIIDVVQQGQGNEVEMYGSSPGNAITIDQNGNDNWTQTSHPGSFGGYEASLAVSQTGNSNWAQVTQDSAMAQADVIQSGSGNFARVEQY